MWLRSRYMLRVNFGSLLDVTIDDRLSWSHHLIDVKTNFVHKLNPPEMEFVLEKKRPIGLILQDNLILPSVLYGLATWGGCPIADLQHSLEVPHLRAARIIYNLPRDMPTDKVYRHSNWNT